VSAQQHDTGDACCSPALHRPRGPGPSPPPSDLGVRPTCGLENPRVAQTVSLSEGLHHPVNFLGLSREAKAPQKLPGGITSGVRLGEPLLPSVSQELASHKCRPSHLSSSLGVV
jgi:hypothetical protein